MTNSSWFVYILQCADGSLYTGITTDITRREHEHNNSTLGARYTRSRRPVTLVYSETLSNRSEASKREHALKKMTHAAKTTLITQHKISVQQ
jgi:putative endonuclease